MTELLIIIWLYVWGGFLFNVASKELYPETKVANHTILALSFAWGVTIPVLALFYFARIIREVK